jgi:hypothetical protein
MAKLHYQTPDGVATPMTDQLLIGVDGRVWLHSREKFTPCPDAAVAVAVRDLPGFAAMHKAAQAIKTKDAKQ